MVAMQNKWVKVGSTGTTSSNGKVARKQWIDGKYYVFDNGKMATGNAYHRSLSIRLLTITEMS